jgi:ElaB/YqjD/DUF883 family membrane-anchored ribosome-binding protein
MVRKTKGKTKEIVTEKAGVVRSSVNKVAKKGRAVADKSIHQSRRAIQSKPLTAVGAGIAAGAAAGVVAGVLLTRKKPGKSETKEAVVEEKEETVGRPTEMGGRGKEAQLVEKATSIEEDDDEIIDDED